MPGRLSSRVLEEIPWGGGLLPALVALFVLVRLRETSGTASLWVVSYGNDLLCLPLVLSLALVAHRLSGRYGHRLLPVTHGLTAVVFFGIFFEVILPRTPVRAVGDPRDALMYLAGFMIFQVGLNRAARRTASPAERERRAALRIRMIGPTFPR